MKTPKILNKIHLVHVMKMIHTMMNQNTLIIRFTEKDPRRGNLSSPSHPIKVDQLHVQESKKRWIKSLIQYTSTREAIEILQHYVGNIDYNASEEDLSKALDKIFQGIRADRVIIPRVNGLLMYGFIKVSWARRAPVKASDLCIKKSSGMVKVNGGLTYFRESCCKDDFE